VSDSGRGWTVFCNEDAANVLEAMRTGGHTELHDQVVLFLRALAIEAGAAADAGKPLPGLPMGDGRYNVDVPRLPILISYTPYPGMREFRVTDLLWLG
jgi:hypothetical protein